MRLFFLMVLATALPVLAQISADHRDDFAAGSSHDWERGTVSNGHLILTADGSGEHGKLVTFAQGDWAGDYTSAGIDSIRVTFENPSGRDLEMRIALGTGDDPRSGTWYSSVESISLPAGGSPVTGSFGLDAAALMRVEGSSSLESVMSSVATLRILHSTTPDARGPNITASVYLDDITAISNLDVSPTGVVESALLLSSYPNPFNPSTLIRFTLPDADAVQVQVFNLSGQLVSTLLEAQLPAGMHQLQWNAQDQQAHALPSGVYFARVSTSRESAVQRMTLLR